MQKEHSNEQKRKKMKLPIVVTLTLAGKIHTGASQKIINPSRCPFVHPYIYTVLNLNSLPDVKLMPKRHFYSSLLLWCAWRLLAHKQDNMQKKIKLEPSYPNTVPHSKITKSSFLSFMRCQATYCIHTIKARPQHLHQLRPVHLPPNSLATFKRCYRARIPDICNDLRHPALQQQNVQGYRLLRGQLYTHGR